jgi:hypothetical protein
MLRNKPKFLAECSAKLYPTLLLSVSSADAITNFPQTDGKDCKTEISVEQVISMSHTQKVHILSSGCSNKSYNMENHLKIYSHVK